MDAGCELHGYTSDVTRTWPLSGRFSAAQTAVVADAMVRAMAAHTLGCADEVRFAHIYALQLAQKGSILEKKMGYLACALFLSEGDDLILLLINTIVRDLGSKNVMEVNIALTAAVELTPGEMAPMIFPGTRGSELSIR